MARKRSRFEKRVVDPVTGELLDPRTTPEYYSMEALRNADVWTPQAIRKEYSRLRTIANKRLEAIGRSEFVNTETYRRNIGQYKPLKELRANEVKYLLFDVSKMLSAETGSLTGLRKQRTRALATLRERGYEFVTKANFIEFGEFMEEWRARKDLHIIGSPTAADLFGAFKEKNLSPDEVKEDFEYWIKHRKELEQLPKKKHKNGEHYNADDYKRLIENADK